MVYPGHVAIYAGGGVIVEAQSTKAASQQTEACSVIQYLLYDVLYRMVRSR